MAFDVNPIAGSHNFSTSSPFSMEEMPKEIMLSIFRFLNAQENTAAQTVCRKWRILLNENSLWQKLLKEDFHIAEKVKNAKEIYHKHLDFHQNITKGRYISKSLLYLNRPFLIQGGKLIIKEAGGNLRISDLATGEFFYDLNAHCSNCLISGENQTFISSSSDHFIKIWNAADGSCLHTLQGHQGVITSLTLLDGGRLASASMDNTVRIWDLDKGECLHTLQANNRDEPISSFLLFQDRQLITGLSNGTIKIWDLQSKDCLYTLQAKIKSQDSLFLHDGKLIFIPVENAGRIKIWDMNSHTFEILQTERSSLRSFFLWDEDKLITASVTGDIEIWDIKTRTRCKNMSTEDGVTVEFLLRAKNGSLVSGSLNGKIRIWDIKNGQCLYTLTGYAMQDSVFLLEEKIFSYFNEKLKIWDFSASQKRIFAEFADILEKENLSNQEHQAVIDRFQKMPEEEKKKIYNELYSLLQSCSQDYSESGEHAFHDVQGISPQKKAQAIRKCQTS